MVKPLRVHYVSDASHDGYEATTHCGIDGWRNDGTSQWYTRRASDRMFVAAHERESVTCLRCISNSGSDHG